MARKPKDETPDEPTEQTPPPADPDQGIRRGGPGDEPAEAPPAAETPDQPSRARVKIGRKEYDVDPDMAAALDERERDYMRGIQMDRRERDELERYRRAAQPTPQPAEPDLSTLVFEDPKRAFDLHEQRITQKMEQKYRTEQATQRMWSKFFTDHADLADEDVLVQAKFSSIFNEIADLPTAKAMDVLADEVRKDILRISRKAKGSGNSTTPPTGRATVEGATGDRPPQPSRPSSDEEPASLSDVIRARARKRREASSA